MIETLSAYESFKKIDLIFITVLEQVICHVIRTNIFIYLHSFVNITMGGVKYLFFSIKFYYFDINSFTYYTIAIFSNKSDLHLILIPAL